MAATNYLQTVNGVLRRLREATVASVSQTTYSTLIGDFVNDALDYIENRWRWIALEQTITITTSSGVAEYVVDGAGATGNIKRLVDDTNNVILRLRAIEVIRTEAEINDDLEDGQPTGYAFSSVASDNDPQITLTPTPDGVYTIKAHVDKSGIELVNDADTILIPPRPVLQLAYAYALDERGDTGGSTGQKQFALAETYIANAIMKDAQKRPEDLIWQVDGEMMHNTNHSQGYR